MSVRAGQPTAARGPGLRLERGLLRSGCALVAGIDEAGRGAWAGPVVAAAVILPLSMRGLSKALAGVNDSKLLTPARRAALFGRIHAVAISVGVGGASAAEVDRDGLLPATRAAMQRAVAMLNPPPQALLIDALDLTAVIDTPQRWMNYGESLSLSIAAASIVAKVSRDRWMTGLEARYPGYGFDRHKGYGTRAHSDALARLGVSDMHRRSYAPIRALCGP